MRAGAAAKVKKIDELVSSAEKDLRRKKPFEAEEHAAAALALARTMGDFQRMAEILPLLGSARTKRLEPAIKHGKVRIIDDAVTDDMPIDVGCYLVQPPLVGADARRLRLAALQRQTAVAVVCREPITDLRLCPIVAISPGTTVRTKIDPPRDLRHPDLDWFLSALQALGDWAIASIDPETEPHKRVDMLLDRINAVPEHERLHEALAEACVEAARTPGVPLHDSPEPRDEE